jgi:hypothetical protein
VAGCLLPPWGFGCRLCAGHSTSTGVSFQLNRMRKRSSDGEPASAVYVEMNWPLLEDFVGEVRVVRGAQSGDGGRGHGFPAMSLYHATKWGIEGFWESPPHPSSRRSASA